MAEQAEQEDRTEAATPRRLAKAREEGQVPLSREAGSVAGLAAGTLAMMLALPAAAPGFAARLAGFLADLHSWDASDGGAAALKSAALAGALMAGPVLAAVMLGSVAAGLLQTGLVLNRAALRPDPGRLDPRRGLKRLFGTDGLIEAGRAIVKLAVLVIILWLAMRAELPLLPRALGWAPQILPGRLLRGVLGLALALLAAQAAIAALDLFWVRLRHARSLRMSREDIRQEQKETEGNPHVKQRLRALRMQRARRRMMAAVPKAAVVVTNPTHYAVVLAYERARNAAPRVVAKGADEVAARIREVAREHRIPIVPNPPLARALYRLELDSEIPPEHFQAVAQIIAYVWGLGRRAPPAASL